MRFENYFLKRKNVINNFLIFLGLNFLFLLFVLMPQKVDAQDASLSIFPQTGTFTVGSTFEVSIFVNTGGNNINAVKVDLKFDPKKLHAIIPAKGLSVVETWIFPPSFSNEKGNVTLQGGFLGRGINTSEGLISIVVFKAMSFGETVIDFMDSSKVLMGEEEGKDILSSINRGTYNIIPTPPMGPQIFSKTHPDQNKWYKNPNVTFSWGKEIGVEGYSYEINDDPFGEPNNIIDTESISIFFEDVREGIQYFHLKAKKANVFGGTSHFMVMIDKTSPSEFKPHLESFGFSPDNYLSIYFTTEDLLSGMDYYQIRIGNYTIPEDVIWSGWLQIESPFRVSTEKMGNFHLFIRAFDKAGNFREEKIQMRIINSFLVLVSGGVQARGLFLPWWLMGILSTIILFGFGFLIFKKVKKKSEFIKVELEKEIREAEKEIEDVRKAEEKLKLIRKLEERGKQEWQRLKGTLRKITKSSDNKENE